MTAGVDTQTPPETSTLAEPLVHTKETSERFCLSASFQQHLRQAHGSAWLSATTLYQNVDRIKNTRYAETMSECRTSSWFARHTGTGEVRVLGSACKLRWCPLCAAAKKTYITHQIADWIQNSKWHRFFTFTLKHTDDDLSDQIDRLYDSFRKLKRSKIWKSGARRGVWFFQIKRSKESGQWHPHIHCVASGPWFDYKQLRKTWLSITGDSKVVGIHAVKDPQGCAQEVARYAASPADVASNSSCDNFIIFNAMHNRRICGVWGLKGVVRLNPPAAEDKGEWENIGSWSSVQELQNTDSKAQAIIEAWSNRQPLPEGITMYEEITDRPTMADIYEYKRRSGYQLTFFH